eukprot:366471-Chlamydomonas_euryale.AAC.7
MNIRGSCLPGLRRVARRKRGRWERAILAEAGLMLPPRLCLSFLRNTGSLKRGSYASLSTGAGPGTGADAFVRTRALAFRGIA